MKFTLKILRFTPGKYRRPRFRSYTVEAQPDDRVLDLLERVRQEQDPSLAYRRACTTGLCGADAMRINGQTALACKVRVNSLKSSLITLEPLAGLPVVKDLVVDQKPFFDQYLQIEPFLSGTENQTKQPPIGSVKAFLLPEVTAACIQCAACTTACPVWRKDHQYLGPAFLVWMHRYIFDPRDQLAETRKELISKEDGIWRCRNAYQCTLCCPQSIPITRAIAEIRIKLIKEKI